MLKSLHFSNHLQRNKFVEQKNQRIFSVDRVRNKRGPNSSTSIEYSVLEAERSGLKAGWSKRG